MKETSNLPAPLAPVREIDGGGTTIVVTMTTVLLANCVGCVVVWNEKLKASGVVLVESETVDVVSDVLELEVDRVWLDCEVEEDFEDDVEMEEVDEVVLVVVESGVEKYQSDFWEWKWKEEIV